MRLRSVTAVRSITVTVGLILAASLLQAPAAYAGVLDVTCTPPSSRVTTYEPPLTLAAQTVTATTSTQLGPCTSLSTPALTSGSAHGNGLTTTLSCLDLLSSGPTQSTVTWNTGAKSVLAGNRVTDIVGATLVNTITGTVGAGSDAFTGDSFVLTAVGPATDITLCTLGLGTVSSIYSTVTLEITSV